MKRLLSFTLLVLSLLAFGETDYTKGVFILNEDWYGHQNSTLNYLMSDDPSGEYWHYRVIQNENSGRELGCTAQYGAIWDGRFYFIAKQEKDPGAAVTGGRITVADAHTMKILFQNEVIDPSGKQCDGRGFIGIDTHKGYISTSNGVWIFDLDTFTVTGMVDGTANPNSGDDKPGSDPSSSLYYGQCGIMVSSGNCIFIAHQQSGIIVIDAESDKVCGRISMDCVSVGAGIGSLVVAKDGSIWASVARDTKGTGFTLPCLLRIDPNTLETETVALADGIYPPSNSWYAWTPDTFCASAVTNTLYWSGGSNSWFTGKMVFKFDVESRTATKIIDLGNDGENWKIYGCSLRPHPVNDELYVSLYHEFSIPTYITRRYTPDGAKIRDYSMIENYWFPSLPIFPETTNPSAIEEISLQAPAVSLLSGGRLRILGGEGSHLEIFNLQGALMRSISIDSPDFIADCPLPYGIYIARVASTTLHIRSFEIFYH